MKRLTFNVAITLFLGFFLAFTIHAQKPSPRIVTGNDFLGNQLPPAVYDIETDANGFVYFTYPGGLWKFNGFTVQKEWELENPLEESFYYDLFKGFNHQVLLSGPFGIGFLRKDSLLKFPVPDSIQDYGKRGYESVYLDENKLLHLAPRYKGYFTVDSLGNASRIKLKPSTVHGFVVINLPDGKPFHYCSIDDNSREPFGLYLADRDSNLQFICEIDKPVHKSTLVKYDNESYLFSNGSYDIIHFDDTGLIKAHKFDFRVQDLFLDSKEHLWIGTIDHGVFKSETAHLNDLDHYFDHTASAIAESFDHGIWFESDLYKFAYKPPLEIPHFSGQNGYPMFSEILDVDFADEKAVVYRKDQRGLIIVDGDDVTELIPPGIDQVNGITRQLSLNSNYCYDKKLNTHWVAYYGELQGWNGQEWQILKLDPKVFFHHRPPRIRALSDGRIVGAVKDEFFEVREGKIIRISERAPLGIGEFTLDADSTLWLTSASGLWVLEEGKFNRPFKDMPEELLSPGLILEYAQGYLWYQPFDDGAYQIKKDTVIPIVDENGKRIKFFGHAVNGKGELWTTIDKKLCRIEVVNDSTRFHYYAFDDLALSHHNYRSLAVSNSEVCIGARDGLFKQQIGTLTNNEILSKVVITEIIINHKTVPNQYTYTLDHNENNINFSFDGISFRRIPLQYSYQLVGLDTIWHKTKHKQVQYTNLSPGKYDFRLRVKTDQSNWTDPISVQFFITKPYWQTWWFRISVLLLSFAIVMLIVWFRIRYIRKKEAEKGRIALELSRLELRALKAQMNPHFIFNTLKSIQNRILNGGKWEANELLIRFSKLIRASLEYSRNDFILLKEEINFLRNYLEIEKQRIPNKFDYKIIVDNADTIEGIYVPALLIQPICENAINYAFEENSGMLTLELRLLKDDLLEVQISDNGIGYFNKQNSGSKKGRPSRGLKIVQSRLDFFKAQDYDTSMKIEPFDKTTNKGTIIVLKLPCQ